MQAFYRSTDKTDLQTLASYFAVHPSIVTLDKQIEAGHTGVVLAKQQYKPQWGINASYGYRDDDSMGKERADFFSVGVSFDIPIFTSRRQDKHLRSAVSKNEALKTDRLLLLRNLMASFESNKARWQRLSQRQHLYQSQLLAQMHEQAEASLTAYTHDDGDFAEVVRARIAELNAEIEALDINVERLKSIVQLNYFFVAGVTNNVQQTMEDHHDSIR